MYDLIRFGKLSRSNLSSLFSFAMVYTEFHDSELDESASRTAKRCLGETPESRSKGLQILRSKLLSVEDLVPRLDDAFLLRFLRVAKFDSNRAFDRVRKYYAVRRKYPHVFDKFYPSSATKCLHAKHFLVSPKRPADHSVLVIHKRGLYTPSTMVYEEMFLLDTLILDYLVDSPITQLCGATIILDFQGYGFQTFLQDTPSRVRMAVDAFQNSFPLRFKSIHVVNAPEIFSLFYNICYPFLTKKIRNRLHFHQNSNDWKSLHAELPVDVLPECYGGTLPDSELIDMSQEVVKKEEFFKEQLQFGYMKKKRGFFY